MGIRRWATRNLQSGDLTALRRVAKWQHVDDPDRLARLRKRNFLTGSVDRPRVTIRGRVALLMKQLNIL